MVWVPSWSLLVWMDPKRSWALFPLTSGCIKTMTWTHCRFLILLYFLPSSLWIIVLFIFISTANFWWILLLNSTNLRLNQYKGVNLYLIFLPIYPYLFKNTFHVYLIQSFLHFIGFFKIDLEADILLNKHVCVFVFVCTQLCVKNGAIFFSEQRGGIGEHSHDVHHLPIC